MGASQTKLPEFPPPTGDADSCWRCAVEWVERREKPPGTRPGCGVEKLVRLGPPGPASFREDVLSNDGAVVWAVHTEEAARRHFLVVAEVDDKEGLWEHSFLDRGLRKIIKEGSSLFFVPLPAVDAADLGKPFRDGRISMNVVYNTGRCGSTLMHKMLLAAGVASFSEPHWCDQLSNMARTADDAAAADDVTGLLRACWFLDVALARRNIFRDARVFSLNPKAFGHTLIPHAVEIEAAVPTKYIFMYRSAPEVVESFGSIFAAGHSRLESLSMKVASFTSLGVSNAMRAPLRGALRGREDALREGLPPHPVAATLTRMWIEAVQGFLDAQLEYADQKVGLARGEALVLRMDEYVTEDLEKRREIVEKVLSHVGVVDPGGDALGSALAVFGVHSQKGTGMSTARREKFLSAEDERRIADCARKCLVSEFVAHDDDGNLYIDSPLQG